MKNNKSCNLQYFGPSCENHCTKVIGLEHCKVINEEWVENVALIPRIEEVKKKKKLPFSFSIDPSTFFTILFVINLRKHLC